MLAGILGSLGGGTGSSDIHGADPWAERECGLRVTGTGPEVPQHRGSPLPLVWPRSGFCVEETWVCGEIARSAEAVAGAWGCLGRLGPLVSCQHVAWLSFSLSPAGLPLVTGYPAYDPHHAGTECSGWVGTTGTCMGFGFRTRLLLLIVWPWSGALSHAAPPRPCPLWKKVAPCCLMLCQGPWD